MAVVTLLAEVVADGAFIVDGMALSRHSLDTMVVVINVIVPLATKVMEVLVVVVGPSAFR